MNNSTIKNILCGAAAIFATTAALATAPSSATQFTPNMMNYQGHLYDPAQGDYGVYADGTYEIECRIYRQETGGTPIWGGVYTVYVKDGYFNIMLGDSSATNLGYTYSNVELWRALWDDEDASVRNDLWLGITMRQDYRHNNIAAGSRSEITPRQRLLAGPYAFRAQAAHYAKESKGGFRVGGDITFATSMATWKIGGRIKSAGDFLTIGVTSGDDPTGSDPVVKVEACNFSVNSYGNVPIKSNVGDITLQTSASKSVEVKNGDFNVNNSKKKISSGSTKLEMTGSTITGIGNLQWAKTSSDTAVAPFVAKKVSIVIGTNQSFGYNDFEAAESSDYSYMVVGFIRSSYQTTDTYAVQDCYVFKTSAGNYRALIDLTSKPSRETTYQIHLLGIHKGLVRDLR